MDKLKELIAEVQKSEVGGVTTCVLILTEGKGSIVGQVPSDTENAEQAAYDQAAAAAVEYLKL